jgi:sugar lactone lactonase YvrE
MTASNDLGRWLSDEFKREAPPEAPDRVLLGALSTIETTSQRHARVPWRTSNMNAFFRVVAVAAAALAIIFGPLYLWPHGSSGTNVSPSPSVSPSPAPLPPTACPAGTVLHSGDIATIAGTGVGGSSGDGGPAISATLLSWDSGGFTGIPPAVDGSGAFYFSDLGSHSVRRIGTDGVITTFVGPASGAQIQQPGGLAFDAQGNLYIPDPTAGRIWKRDPTGKVTSVAGTGTPGSSGNEGPASQAQITAGTVLIDAQGNIYFDDMNAVRRIDANGIVHAFAGTGVAGFSGDGGPALQAEFNGAFPAAVGPDGSIYVGDPGNARIRRIGPTGTVETIVGNGQTGYVGDGGPATNASLMQSPYSLALAPDGSFFFSDWQNNSVRKVDSGGMISTVVGVIPFGGSSGDCGPATKARLNGPQGIVLHDGTLFIVDGQNNRIRMVVP